MPYRVWVWKAYSYWSLLTSWRQTGKVTVIYLLSGFGFFFIGHYICPLTWESPPEFTYLVLLLFTREGGRVGIHRSLKSGGVTATKETHTNTHTREIEPPLSTLCSQRISSTYSDYAFWSVSIEGWFWNNDGFNSEDCVMFNETGRLPWMVTR
jgi:hypothetical protein